MHHGKDHSPTSVNVHQEVADHEKLTIVSSSEIQQDTHEAKQQSGQEKTPEHYKTETEQAHNLAASEKQHRERTPHTPSAPERHRGPIKVDEEFTHTIVSIQQEMPSTQRAFSRFIHTKPIEVASDFVATTIARPNAMLAGSISAFVLMLALYLFTKSIGYTLSGFELIATFVIGWFLGMFYDYIRIMLGNNK